MKILVINGSPKGERSNSLKLTEAFLKGMEEAACTRGEAPEVRRIHVSALKIAPCRGCFVCWNKTPGACCMSDDMNEVLNAQLWADVIIWSFPLYYFNVPGMLKNLIDRQLPMVLPFMADRKDGVGNGSHEGRYDMSGKKHLLISTCGFYTAKENYGSVVRMFDHICGKGQYETIFCGQGELFRVEELSSRTGAYLKIVEQAGREYVDGAVSVETKKKLEELLFPKEVFEAMADASWGIDRENGKKEEDALIFTRQMAALYRKEAFDGRERVLEMCYTDLGVTYQISLSREGSLVEVENTKTFTTRIETPFSVWQQIARGEIRGDEALANQLYRVKGDFSLMMNWDTFFGETNAEADDVEHRSADASLMQVLLPWIVFWIAVPINGFIGALISAAVCVMLPLIFYQNKKPVYDALSGATVGVLSILLAAGCPARFMVSLSYLMFGLMWVASCKTKIPLTAYYVMGQYQGKKALKNPIFIDTNRILTCAWGVLYLLTAAWTYFLMGTELGSLTGALNSVVPLGMSIFTGWFQKWYPAWVAGGRGK